MKNPTINKVLIPLSSKAFPLKSRTLVFKSEAQYI